MERLAPIHFGLHLRNAHQMRHLGRSFGARTSDSCARCEIWVRADTRLPSPGPSLRTACRSPTMPSKVDVQLFDGTRHEVIGRRRKTPRNAGRQLTRRAYLESLVPIEHVQHARLPGRGASSREEGLSRLWLGCRAPPSGCRPHAACIGAFEIGQRCHASEPGASITCREDDPRTRACR